MMSEAAKWLDKGPIWRHPDTGEIAGTVRDEAVSLSELLFRLAMIPAGLVAFCTALPPLAAWIVALRWHRPLTHSHMVLATVFGLALAIVVFCFVIAITGFRARCWLFSAVLLLLAACHVPVFILAPAVVFCCFGVISIHYDPRSINARMRAQGYRKVIAKPRTSLVRRSSEQASWKTTPIKWTPPPSHGRSKKPSRVLLSKEEHFPEQVKKFKRQVLRSLAFLCASLFLWFVAGTPYHTLRAAFSSSLFFNIMSGCTLLSAAVFGTTAINWMRWRPDMSMQDHAAYQLARRAADGLLSQYPPDVEGQPPIWRPDRRELIANLSTPQALEFLRQNIATPVIHQYENAGGFSGVGLFWKPNKTADHPYGWVFDPSVPGYVTRRADLHESPIPEFVQHVPEPDIVSPHKPRPGDDIGPITIVRHRYTRPDGKEAEADFRRPGPSKKYPYGWVFDPSVPGYMPRHADPYESPIPDYVPHVPEPDIDSRNKPRPGDDIGPITIVRHRYTRPDGRVVEADFKWPGPSKRYPYGWVFDPNVPGYMPRQADPYESPAAEPLQRGPDSTVHGDNDELPTDHLRTSGNAHPMPPRSDKR